MNEPKVAVMRVGEVPGEAYTSTDIHWLVSKKTNGARELTLGYTTIEAGGRNPLHRHPNCEEALYVLAGEIEHIVEGTPNARMKAGEAILVPRNAKHQAINVGATTAELLVAFSSAERETIVEDE
jgi:quercetin dioxygenase-like cupin family protein